MSHACCGFANEVNTLQAPKSEEKAEARTEGARIQMSGRARLCSQALQSVGSLQAEDVKDCRADEPMEEKEAVQEEEEQEATQEGEVELPVSPVSSVSR